MGNLPACVGRSKKLTDKKKESVKLPRRQQPDDTVDAATVSSVATVDSYEARMRIDDDVLIRIYRQRMTNGDGRNSSTSRRRSSGPRVTFRTGSFDSQASTESERLNFIMSLVDSLQETFLDDDHATAAGQQLLVAAQVNECGGVNDVNDRDVIRDDLAAEQQSKALLSSLAPSSSDQSRVTASKTRSVLEKKPESSSSTYREQSPINSKFSPTNGCKSTGA